MQCSATRGWALPAAEGRGLRCSLQLFHSWGCWRRHASMLWSECPIFPNLESMITEAPPTLRKTQQTKCALSFVSVSTQERN